MIALLASALIAIAGVTAFSPAPQDGAAAPTPADAAPAPASQTAQPVDTELAAALTALSPDAPRDYFLLAERVADLAAERSDDALRRLARHLAVLSYELTRRAGAPADDTARSVCLLLASIAPSPAEARWLRALAGTFDRDVLGAVYEPPGTGPSRDEAALDAATVLGLARTGQGRRAQRLLDKPGVADLLQRHERILSPAGLGGELDRLRRTIADWPTCPQCRGKRVIVKLDNNGRLAGVILCDTCAGLPGPATTLSELVRQLRLEAILLSGVQRSWSGQILIDAGAPLRELDPAELAPRLGIDPLKPLWRDGVWTAPPGAPAPAAPTPPAADPAPTQPPVER
jgi:hypothetical protein